MKPKRPPSRISRNTTAPRVVFLLDVDNTLLDNDRVAADLRRHLEREVGRACERQYWAIFERLRAELGYADYLGALQRYRIEHAHDHNLFSISSYLVNYPFENRLYPNALDVVERCQEWGIAVILSDGDVVFQPRKIERSGLFEAVERNVMIYVHKEHELKEIERRFPADHYVLVDDKLRILTAVKQAWGPGVTTVFPRQGHYANDLDILRAFPPPDVTLDRIGDLLGYDVDKLVSVGQERKGKVETKKAKGSAASARTAQKEE